MISGAGFASKSKYLFGKVNMQIKLVEGDSAGTVTAYYVSIITLLINVFILIKTCLKMIIKKCSELVQMVDNSSAVYFMDS